MLSESISLILWLIPGFIFFGRIRTIQKIKEQGNWSFVIPISMCSIFFFLISRVIVVVALTFLPEPLLEILNKFKSSIYSFPFFYTWFLSIFISTLIGSLFVRLYFYSQKIVATCECAKIKEFFIRVRGIIDFVLEVLVLSSSDDFIQRLYSLSGKIVIINLKNNKIYIGLLRSYSTDSHDAFKVLSIAPLWSGTRKNGETAVTYDTYYGEINTLRFASPLHSAIEITFPFSELMSIGEFDKDLNDYFISIGKSKFEPLKKS